ncbi:hypothetical protein HY498_05130 [Candidatus Woesearchaeota archaeon]|nr:hypothetical protein [Candidatus Woesearchaeota archaeon]
MPYPKLASNENCRFPDRKDCNYSGSLDRCIYMYYDNPTKGLCAGKWRCSFKKK